ncbi:hypothetical protein [Fusibacter ferrireducens]|uniref:Uncharacterized protein n=1 Tax=Fusibacter ferrireducens TaxID=2785058 RepID=A0ABR9ZZM9_9FIRM|nr:hypothetical protein [Fusibacter ferrireducens]MBF4695902.1 hypothetical protein [Fusibacter ferrireducens]
MYNRALKELINEWHHLKVSSTIEGKRFTAKEQQREYKLIMSLITSIMALLKQPYDQKAFDQMIKDYMDESKILDTSNVALLFNKEMIQATIDFYEQAKAFNSEMNIEDIGQAMRNVWIINLIQQLEGKPSKLSSSAFGYSMLYPYTDNLLDDTDMDLSYKKEIMTRFGKRLAGLQSNSDDALNPYEQDLFKLIAMVESEYERDDHPMVYESMLGIHHAQLMSQRQHCLSIPYETSILEYTFEKGGTSVLADACIVCGKLTEAQMLFYMQYGIVLQLCDDFQDMVEDQTHRHQTIFSQLMGHYKLDPLILKTLSFNEKMIQRLPQKKWASIYRNCILMMIAFSSLNYRAYLSRDFYKKLIAYAPLTRRQYKKIEREVKRSQKVLLLPDTIKLFKTYISEMSLDI